MDLLIFLEYKTARTDYIFHHIFHDILGLKIKYTTDKSFFINYKLPKIQYGFKSICNDQSVFFQSVDLLFENDIKKQEIVVSSFRDYKIFFMCESDNSVFPFDVFAASFYMVTRYEEYVALERDDLGRFLADSCLAVKHNFLDYPIVDKWIIHLKKILKENFPGIKFKNQKFEFINTIDVDSAYSYLDKGVFRTFISVCKDVLLFNFKNLKSRLQVIFFGATDPYDNFDKILELHNKYNLKTFFFFLLSDLSYYDRNTKFNTKRFVNLISKIYKTCHVGIHASFFSSKNFNKLNLEISRLSKLINSQVINNRQHYINLDMPKTYRNLIKNGIQHDFSMGFPSHPGFRAGTSYSFIFFDLASNCSTNLEIHPFAIMDVTLKDYLKLNHEEAFDVIKKIVQSIIEVNGNFISIFHNESLDDSGRWAEWSKLYENMICFINDEKH